MFASRFFWGFILSAFVLCGAPANTGKQKFFPPKTEQRHPLQQPVYSTTIVNAASYLPGVSPGGLATAFGTNLSDITGTITAGTNPFPLSLSNVSVTVNGVSAPIFSVAYANGEDQISFAVPWETETGMGAADVRIFDYGQQVAEQIVDSYTEDPGIFGFSQYGNTYAVALHGNYLLVTPNNPASPGEVVLLYTTGLGPVNQQIPDGLGAPSNPLADTVDPFQVILAGENAQVLFSGLAPGFVGLYQVNFVVPDDAPAGDLNLQIYSSYANSQKVLLSVQ